MIKLLRQCVALIISVSVGIIAVNLLGEPIMDGGSIKTKYLTDDFGFSNRNYSFAYEYWNP
ncbi:UNVERIFIED_CONTAM: hypothetical protein NCL1_59512 [Trichonephila clavipes]